MKAIKSLVLGSVLVAGLFGAGVAEAAPKKPAQAPATVTMTCTTIAGIRVHCVPKKPATPAGTVGRRTIKANPADCLAAGGTPTGKNGQGQICNLND